MTPLGCTSDYNFMTLLLISTTAPIAFSVLLFIIYAMESVVVRERILLNPHRHPGPTHTQETLTEAKVTQDEINNRYLNYFLYLTYFLLPYVATRIFRTFLCSNLVRK
jgi:hypothetical protein